MKKASEIINLDIIASDTGQKIEKVKDILYDDNNDTIKALLVDAGGWFKSAKILPYSSISSIGENAVIVQSSHAIMTADSMDDISGDPEDHPQVKNKTVMTEGGKNLGKIADLVIDENTGKVTHYIVSGGIFQDMYKGQPMIDSTETLQVGDDVVFVSNATADRVQEYSGGLKGATQNAVENVQQAGKNIAANAQEAGHKIQHQASSHETQQNLNNAQEKMSEGWGKIKQKTQQVIDKTKDSITQSVETNRINGAIGRTVNRVVLTPNDVVLLQPGKLITNEIIHQARNAGVLSLLLDSVENDTEALQSTNHEKTPTLPRNSQ